MSSLEPEYGNYSTTCYQPRGVVPEESPYGEWYNSNPRGRGILSTWYLTAHPVTWLQKCCKCGRVTTPKKCCERVFKYAGNVWRLMGLECESDMCMSCYNKMKPINKRLVEEETARLHMQRMEGFSYLDPEIRALRCAKHGYSPEQITLIEEMASLRALKSSIKAMKQTYREVFENE